MKKTATAIAVTCLCLISLYYLNRPWSLPYDDHDAMLELVKMSDEELTEMGCSGREVRIIRAYPQMYSNYELLQSYIERKTYRCIGYHNQSCVHTPQTAKNEVTAKANDDIIFSLSIPDYFKEKPSERDKCRLLTEFTLQKPRRPGRYTLRILFPHFSTDSIYSVARYVQKDDAEKFVDFPIELPDDFFFAELSCEIETKKVIEDTVFILQSCILIMDMSADIRGPDIKFDTGFSASLESSNIFQRKHELCKEEIKLKY